MGEYAVIVIGGGITGLCAASRLAQRIGNENVLVLEQDMRPGGTAKTDVIDGLVCEWGPNGFLDREPLMLDWVDELGLTPRLIRAQQSAARRFIVRNGVLHEIKPPPAFFFSKILSLRGKLRLLKEPWVPPKQGDDFESIYDFAARRIGQEAAEYLITPMVSGIFGGDAHQLSLTDCFPRMAQMEREYGGLVRALLAMRKKKSTGGPMGPTGTLTSFPLGVGELVDTAAKRLGASLCGGQSVKSIVREGAAFTVTTSSGMRFTARVVIIATPAYAAAELLDGISPHSHALHGIPYAPVAVVCTAYPKEALRTPLEGFGFLMPRAEGKRVLGCLWTHSIFPDHAPRGMVLLRTMYGGGTDPEAVALSDSELLNLVKTEVHPLVGLEKEPVFVRIFRHRRGIPQYTRGHKERVAQVRAIESENPGLYIAGNAYCGVGMNDCVVSAERAVSQAAQWLGLADKTPD